MSESLVDPYHEPTTDERVDAYALQIAETIKAIDISAKDREAALTELLTTLRTEYVSDFIVFTAWQLLGDRRADVRLCALELLRPFSGYDDVADILLLDVLLKDRADKVFVPTYEMLREHYQNATFEDLSGQRVQREFTFPGARLGERVVKMSAAIPRYEYATRNRKQSS